MSATLQRPAVRETAAQRLVGRLYSMPAEEHQRRIDEARGRTSAENVDQQAEERRLQAERIAARYSAG